MFQAWPVKIIRTAASSRPTLLDGKERDQREHQAGHEAEHRDALQDVEQRDEDAFGALVLGGPVAVDEREAEREHVGDEAARRARRTCSRAAPTARGRSRPSAGARPATRGRHAEGRTGYRPDQRPPASR